MTIAGIPSDNMMYKFAVERMEKRIKWVDKQLASNKFLAGDQLTAADIMAIYSLTTQRYWYVTLSESAVGCCSGTIQSDTVQGTPS